MTNPREILVTVARRFVGIHETSKNRFLGDAKVWESTEYPDGHLNREPYCAAFICHVVRLADMESLSLNFNPRPRSASVRGWRDWVRRPSSGVYVFTDPTQAQAGDIMSMLPGTSHIALVVGQAGEERVRTIEANTDAEGSREGDGIWEKTRRYSSCGEFYRLPCVPFVVHDEKIVPY